MLVRSLICASVFLAVAGCGPKPAKRACTGGAGQSPLVADAVMVRLDVYGSSARCVGGQLADGAGTPLLSHSYDQGQAITLDVPPGPHALVLSTFADSDGTQLLGIGCTEADLSAGSQICFDLTIGPAPDDLSASSSACSSAPDNCPAGQYCAAGNCVAGCKDDPDCVARAEDDGGTSGLDRCDPATRQCVQCLSQTDCVDGTVCTPSHTCAPGCDPALGKGCPGTLSCCNKFCVDTTSDKLNCGGCGTACSTTNANVTQCSNSMCGWTCNNGFKHCAAGNSGCDTNIFNVGNCGGCGLACDQTNSVGATCPAGTCLYTSCKSGYADCTTANSDANGCETHVDADPANCGACGRPCSNSNVGTLHCTAGLCDSTCAANFGNCSMPPAGATPPYAPDDGCESNLTACMGTACCSMTAPTPPNMCMPSAQHSNGPASFGLGQSYADCHALGVPDDATSYTPQMANEAMAAAPGTDVPSAMCGNALCVWKYVASRCVVWCYTNDTTAGGSNIAGHVYQNTAAKSNLTCSNSLCPLETDPPWY